MSDAIIGALATVVAGTVGALVVVWQIGEQAKQALRQNRDNEAVKLKLRVYEEVAGICRRAVHAEIELGSYARAFEMSVGLIETWQGRGLPWQVPRQRVPELQRLNREFDSALLDAISATERWQVIDPRIDLFRFALNAAMHDAREAYMAYHRFAVRAMPMEIPDEQSQGRLFPWRLPNVREANDLTHTLSEALGTCGAYLGDMQTEMQNLLIGELFGHRIAAREPVDPRLVAVRLDRYDELKRHFETETAWGRRAQEVMSEVRSQFASNEPDENGSVV